MTFESITHAVGWCIGLALTALFSLLMFIEVRVPPSHTTHLVIFGSGMLVGLTLMGLARIIADGLGAIGKEAKPFIPWRRSSGTTKLP